MTTVTKIKGVPLAELSNPPKDEKKVREWFSDWYKRCSKPGAAGLTWIEFALGGSPGVPDVLVPTGGKLVGVELKLGEFRGSDGALLAKFRPAQVNWHIEMARGGIKTFAIIATRMGHFCVRGKDVVQFANGFCEHWPEYADKIAGDIHMFFSRMEDEVQHAESIAIFKKNVERIDREMAIGMKKMAAPIDPKAQIGSRVTPSKTRAGAAATSNAAVASKAGKSARALSPPIVVKKAKAICPPNATARKSKPASQTRAKLAKTAPKPGSKSPRKSVITPPRARSA